MLYKIDTHRNDNGSSLTRRITERKSFEDNLLPACSPTVKQLTHSKFLLAHKPCHLQPHHIEDFTRRGEVWIQDEYIDIDGADHFDDEVIQGVMNPLRQDNSRLGKIILDFIKNKLIHQTTFLYAIKETFVERIRLKCRELDIIPVNLDEVSSSLRLTSINDHTFEVCYIKGLAFKPLSAFTNSRIQPTLSGVFDLTVRFSLQPENHVHYENYINWPAAPFNHIIYTTHVNANYYFNDEKMKPFVNKLGFFVAEVNYNEVPKQITQQLSKCQNSPMKTRFGTPKLKQMTPEARTRFHSNGDDVSKILFDEPDSP
jgi:hypothetical protein